MKSETTETKRFRIKLLHGYFPADPEHPKHPMTGSVEKVKAGEVWLAPVEEGKRLLKEKVAELPDDWEPGVQ